MNFAEIINSTHDDIICAFFEGFWVRDKIKFCSIHSLYMRKRCEEWLYILWRIFNVFFFFILSYFCFFMLYLFLISVSVKIYFSFSSVEFWNFFSWLISSDFLNSNHNTHKSSNTNDSFSYFFPFT